jgi:sec-independent protein translocase protein TatB
MFDIGLSEILIIAIVALVVLGPERLPKAARLAGFWVRKARSQWYSVKAELESEMADEELKNSLKESMVDLQKTLNEHQESLQHEMRELDTDLQQTLNDQKKDMQALGADLSGGGGESKADADAAASDAENTPRP